MKNIAGFAWQSAVGLGAWCLVLGCSSSSSPGASQGGHAGVTESGGDAGSSQDFEPDTAGGSGGAGTLCSGQVKDPCPEVTKCSRASCSVEMSKCYGPNFFTKGVATGACAALGNCSVGCGCGDSKKQLECLSQCASRLTESCQACLSDVDTCEKTKCKSEEEQCVHALGMGGASGTGGAGASAGHAGAPGDPNVCAAATDDAGCDTCLKSQCCLALSDCTKSSECVVLSVCLTDCTDDDCIDTCIGAHLGGAAAYLPLKECAAISCSTECR